VTVAAVWRSTRREVHWEVSGSAADTGEPFRVQAALASWQDAQGDAGELMITGSFGTGRLEVRGLPVSFPPYLTTLKEPDLWRLLFRDTEVAATRPGGNGRTWAVLGQSEYDTLWRGA
jgi:hypothetical protein